MQRKQFIMLIILLVVGFASATTTIVLNGNVGMGVNLDDFDVVFIEAFLDGGASENVTISEDKKTITFTTDRFINKGDSARLDYKVKNISNQYDADVTINCTNESNGYVDVTSSFDGNVIPLITPVNIEAQEVKSGYINAELTKSYAGEDKSFEIKCSIEFTATSRDTYAYTVNFDSQGGSEVEYKSVILNNSYGELPSPTKMGYTFIGWYDEEDNKVDESTVLDSKGDKTLYAKWEEQIYSVNIVTNVNGTSESSIINIAYGKTSDIKIIPDNSFYISRVECNDGYTVDNYNSKTPQYGEQTISIKNNRITESGTCTFTFEQGIFEYGYTGSSQTFIAPLNGTYKIETWGAGKDEARGAYTSGNLTFSDRTPLFLYVGGAQSTSTDAVFNSGTKSVIYNNSHRAFSSSGATDVRTINGAYNSTNSLISRIMVAAGSGADGTSCSGGSGGGLIGYDGTINASVTSNYSYGKGATQISGGVSFNSTNGTFGIGAQGVPEGSTDFAGSGGGGWYGGGAGFHNDFSACGGGGSSYISGHTGSVAVTSLSSSTPKSGCTTGTTNNNCSLSPTGYVFKDTVMIDGDGYKWTNVKGSYTGMPTHDGTSTMIGNSDNGYAKITLLSID